MNIYIPPIIEKVYNVQGSTAGAGSGEFHRYRALRRRERARVSAMEKEYHERRLQREFEERKHNMNEIFEKKTEKKRERRKKKEEKKKMVKKLSKLAEGVNKYQGKGNYIEEFQKEAEKNPEILANPEENDPNNFDDFDYNLEVPKEIKKQLRKIEVEKPVDIIPKEEMHYESDDFDESYEDEDSEVFEQERKIEVEKPIENIKVKELPKNLFIFDNDL